MSTARNYDLNGWPEIQDNPISKTGVFEYLGSTIDAPNPDRIYRVYRPESELSDPDCINSFKLLPWIIDHEMLGEGETPAERKGIQGVIGERVYYDDGYLKGNIKVFSDHLNRLIDTGQKELSLGYKCAYEFTSGTFNGEQYDAIQRDIRGNHIATVEEGRMGPEVAVLDRAIVTFDAQEFSVMSSKTPKDTPPKAAAKPAAGQDEEMQEKGEDGEIMEEGKDEEMSLSAMSEMITKLMPLLEEVEKMKAMMNGHESEAPMMEQEEMDGEEMEYEAEDAEEKESGGMDSVNKTIHAMQAEINQLRKSQKAMDSRTVFQKISDRDDMADRLSHFIGTFDHRHMTDSDVAKYGVEKLSIPCMKGHEVAALTAWMHDRKPDTTLIHATATDQQLNGSPVDDLFKRV